MNKRARSVRLSELWSCFTCDYLGFPGEDDNGTQHCPECGTQEGDGFGMAVNDPRYRDYQHDMIVPLNERGGRLA